VATRNTPFLARNVTPAAISGGCGCFWLTLNEKRGNILQINVFTSK
jgi:hypothetical protein